MWELSYDYVTKIYDTQETHEQFILKYRFDCVVVKWVTNFCSRLYSFENTAVYNCEFWISINVSITPSPTHSHNDKLHMKFECCCLVDFSRNSIEIKIHTEDQYTHDYPFYTLYFFSFTDYSIWRSLERVIFLHVCGSWPFLPFKSPSRCCCPCIQQGTQKTGVWYSQIRSVTK